MSLDEVHGGVTGSKAATFVTNVQKNGPAERAGLQTGHQIIAVNDTPVITATKRNTQRKWILQQLDLFQTIRITVLITAPPE